jgi:hypothetical protein
MSRTLGICSTHLNLYSLSHSWAVHKGWETSFGEEKAQNVGNIPSHPFVCLIVSNIEKKELFSDVIATANLYCKILLFQLLKSES